MPAPAQSWRYGCHALMRTGKIDPFLYFGFDFAWRADDAIDNGSKTTSIPSYIGSLTLTAQGTGQAIKANSANLNNKKSIVCDGVTASGGYSAVLPGGTPAAATVVQVFYAAAVTVIGFWGVTVGGTVSTGFHAYRNTTVRTGKVGTDASHVVTAPLTCVQGSVLTSSGITSYLNSLTAVTASQAGALAGSTIHWMCRASQASVPQVATGEAATLGIKLAALGPGEMRSIAVGLGQIYSRAIAA